MIYKKGDTSDPQNYRPIALINVMTKLFTGLLYNRLIDWMEINKILPEEQMGFRPGRDCTYGIFCLSSIMNIHLRNQGRHGYVIFVDLKRAFDTVSQFAMAKT